MRHKSEVTTTRVVTTLVGWLVVVLALAGSARAQEYRGTEEQRMACTGDVFRLCFSEIPNVGRIVGCLQREKQQLSAGCRAVFDHYSNVRVAYDRWQRRHHHLASATDRLAPGQPVLVDSRAEVATASAEPASTGSISAAKDARPAVTQSAREVRSKASLRSSQSRSKLALRSGHSKHRMGRLHRQNLMARHRFAFVTGKQYRHRTHEHRG